MSHLRRHSVRAALAGGLALLLVLAAEASFRAATAEAIVRAPNFGRTQPPPRLDPPDAVEIDEVLRVPVGPPAAELSAWVMNPARARPLATILVLHGVRLDKRSTIRVGQAFTQAGFRSVLVDLRGHGESTGSYLSYGAIESRDISQLLDALCSDHKLAESARSSAAATESGACSPSEHFGIWGFSYGAAVAISAAACDDRLDAVVAVAPFTSLRAVVRDYERRYFTPAHHLIPEAWVDAAVTDAAHLVAFNPEVDSPAAAAKKLDAPLLLVHGDADTQVAPRHSRTLSALARNSRLVSVPGASHAAVLADASSLVRRESVSWFTRWLAEPARRPDRTGRAPRRCSARP
jgi:pimeloyl-ACP methyl ester carboxylesterase